MRGAGLIALACCALAAASCGGDIVHRNPPLGTDGTRAEPDYTYESLLKARGDRPNSEEILVIVSFSGGGMRAAALAYGVLQQLREATIHAPGDGRPRTVLQEVDVISSNSGGSFVAAYYAVHREKMFESDGDRTRFERDFLKHNITRDLIREASSEILAIGTPTVNRSDVAAAYYDRRLGFNNTTYGQLVAKGRPYLMINAQDTTKRARFEFTQAQFDLICSDLSGFPLSRALTASSAFHGVFAPIKLRNHPVEHCPKAVPAWIGDALNEKGGDPNSLLDSARSRRARARLALWYRDKLPDGLSAPKGTDFFVHLADGGAADNSALRAPMFMLTSRDAMSGPRVRLERGQLSAVLLIAVNAAVMADPKRDTDPAGPTITGMIKDAADGLVRTASEDSLREGAYAFALLRERARRLGHRTRFYGPVMVEFESVKDEAARACFKRIETKLDLPPAQVDALRLLGRHQIARAPDFEKFVQDHKGSVGQQPPPLLAADTVCPGRPGGLVAAAE